MNQGVTGEVRKEKILDTFCKSLSLPSTLTSHLKGKHGEKEGLTGGSLYSPTCCSISSLEQSMG